MFNTNERQFLKTDVDWFQHKTLWSLSYRRDGDMEIDRIQGALSSAKFNATIRNKCQHTSASKSLLNTNARTYGEELRSLSAC